MFRFSSKGSNDDNMNVAQAREYVYDFADKMALGASLIGDASTLPCSRDKLRQAFHIYFAWMNAERDKDPVSFEKEGYGDTLRAAESCYVRIDDYHDIAPEDKAAVTRANKNPSSHISDEAIDLLGKYPPGGAEQK